VVNIFGAEFQVLFVSGLLGFGRGQRFGCYFDLFRHLRAHDFQGRFGRGQLGLGRLRKAVRQGWHRAWNQTTGAPGPPSLYYLELS
jgi:hypothetical protein